MPRVTTVMKCRKDQGPCSKCGSEIRRGDSYKWWAFMIGGRGGQPIVRCSKPECAPTPKDLTSSEFHRSLYDIEERVQGALQSFRDNGSLEDLQSELESVADDLRSLGEEQQEKYDNMPEGLQQGDVGQLLETRAQECDSKADEIGQAADDAEEFLDLDDWKKFAEEESIEREAEETDAEFEERVKEEISEQNEEKRSTIIDAVEGAIDLSID